MDRFWRLEFCVRAERMAGASASCLLAFIAMTFVGATITGPHDVLRSLHDMPGATYLHGGLAIALMIFGACRLCFTLFGGKFSQGRSETKTTRFARMGGGAASFVLGAMVLGAALDGLGGSVSMGRSGAEALLGVHVGGTWLVFIGLLFFAASARQFANAWTEKLSKWFGPDIPAWVVPLQGAGLAARADVSFIIGYAFFRAGWLGGLNMMTGIDDVFTALVENTELSILLVFALLLSGISSFAVARWQNLVCERSQPLLHHRISRVTFR